MITSVFVGVSLDGFIARLDGAYDFLPAMAVSRTAMLNSWPLSTPSSSAAKPSKPFLLFPIGLTAVGGSSSLAAARGGRIEQMSGDPAEVVSRLSARGFKHVYVDGGITVQNFLRAGRIQRIIINRYPVLIGDGIPLFGSLPHDVQLCHVATQTSRSGQHCATRTCGLLLMRLVFPMSPRVIT